MTLRARLVPVGLALVLLGAAAGCGGSASSTSSGGVAKLEVGVVPVIDVAPLFLGVSKGFFTEEQLDVTPKPIQAGATIAASVVSGALPIGFANNTSLLIAASKNLPIHLVAAGNQAADGDYAGVIAGTESGIRTPQDLVGKKIGVNGLNNVGSLTVNAGLEANGVDYTKLTYVEIPFPDMAAALSQKRVDAVWAVEPFVSAIKAAGSGQMVFRPYPAIAPHFPVASYFTSENYRKANASVVDRFRRAMNKSLEYAQTHPDEVRKILPTYIKITQQVADQVVLPEWSKDIGAELLGRTADYALKYGYLTTKPDIAKLTAT